MSLPDIPDEELDQMISQSLESVFKTMLGFGLEYRSSKDFSGVKAPVPDLGGEEMSMVYVGSVGFVGKVHGVVYLYMKSKFVERSAAKITGLDKDGLDYEITSDVCGELTNVFAGSFKNGLADRGYSSVLTIPTVLSGDELYISTMGVVKHHRLNFFADGDEVVADLVLADPKD
ncbi:chemotaxis protein CheX [Pelagicoccus sp. SDUM812003]|uniref:chemotaxis protein CheX n=1 Tax=Pelagicoccus sp. SDUM812003 TaxID=3041267 RepID=UPI00280E59F2|nr:chemotaxis protein CheX [Pelagicoccus sp. SDUM812003]MDQ8205351.1 chemotaxis protein CheX [Pelagicoccus sp. SDUM812003]